MLNKISDDHLVEATFLPFIVYLCLPSFDRRYHTANKGTARLVRKDCVAAALIPDIAVWCSDGCEPGFVKLGHTQMVIDWNYKRDRHAIDLAQVD